MIKKEGAYVSDPVLGSVLGSDFGSDWDSEVVGVLGVVDLGVVASGSDSGSGSGHSIVKGMDWARIPPRWCSKLTL